MGFGDWLNSLYSQYVPYTRNAGFKTFVTVVLSSGLTAFALLSAQASQRKLYRKQLRDDVESHFPGNSSRKSVVDLADDDDDEIEDYSNANRSKKQQENGHASPAQQQQQSGSKRKRIIDEEIIKEQLARNIAFLGEEAQNKIRNSFVIVVGVGGVGSAAATILVRSGIGKIRLVDFDQVTLSSLNRHSVATLNDVGTPKVIACKKQFEEIAPWVNVDAQVELFSLADADRLLAGNPDWVLDCIDNIPTKVDLLAYCQKRDIKVFSAMGAGGKWDPTRVQISDISTTYEDPLARSVRIGLKKEGVKSGIPVVYSTEVPSKLGKLLPLPEEEFQKGSVHELSALEAFRVRILPVLGPLPCMFGQAAAAYIITALAGNIEMKPLAVKNRHKIYHRLTTDLAARELRVFKNNTIPLNEDDVAYIFEEMYRGRSVVAPTFTIASRPVLSKWDKNLPLTWSNVVVFERNEATKHEKECLLGDKTPEELWGPETAQLVKKRQELEKEMRDYRLL